MTPGRHMELGPAALYGLPGDVVAAIGPHTEADPAAILVSFLVGFGAAAGRGPHAKADGASHPPRIFGVLTGATSKARKGTSWARTRPILAYADPGFIEKRVLGGFGSGESLVDTVAQEDDHRLLVIEPEWGRLLAVGRRDGATLSPLLREAWDGGRLAVRSRAGTVVAEEAHVAVLGHITRDELRSKLTDVEVANGFANRHLFVSVERSKLLPSGGELDDSVVTGLGQRVRSALESIRMIGLMRRTSAAEERWTDLYHEMAADEPGGLVGAVIARDTAQVLRLSVCYALTDGSRDIDLPHLEAAWAVWAYCRKSVTQIFGERTGDPLADRLLDAVIAAGEDGLTTDAQHAALGRHTKADRLRAARELLMTLELAEVVRMRTAGRSAEVLRVCEISEISETRGLSSHSSLISQSPADIVPPDVRAGWEMADLSAEGSGR